MFVIDEFKYLDERGEEDLDRQSSEQVSYKRACTFCYLHRIHSASRSWGGVDVYTDGKRVLIR
jgi:hypothetical protein